MGLKEMAGFCFLRSSVHQKFGKVLYGGTSLIGHGTWWQLGDEKSINVWCHIWITNKALVATACSQLDAKTLQWLVGNAWEVGHGWKLELFAHMLPSLILMMLAEIVLDPDGSTTDRARWLETGGQSLSVHSDINSKWSGMLGTNGGGGNRSGL